MTDIVVNRVTRVKVVHIRTPGIQGPKGKPGITVSATPPEDPKENDLWVDIS